MDIEVENPYWVYKRNEDKHEYGETVKHIFEHLNQPKAITIARSLGGQTMECPEDSWQVRLDDTTTKCFGEESNAVRFCLVEVREE